MSNEAVKYEPSFVAPPIWPIWVNAAPLLADALTLTNSPASRPTRR